MERRKRNINHFIQFQCSIFNCMKIVRCHVLIETRSEMIDDRGENESLTRYWLNDHSDWSASVWMKEEDMNQSVLFVFDQWSDELVKFICMVCYLTSIVKKYLTFIFLQQIDWTRDKINPSKMRSFSSSRSIPTSHWQGFVFIDEWAETEIDN